jgi:hypothetical protein
MRVAAYRNAAEQQRDADALVVRRSTWVLVLLVVSSLAMEVLAAVSVFGFPPSLRLSIDDVLGLLILTPLTAVSLVLGLSIFSPQPLCCISHAGVRTYSLFGLFGTRLYQWPHIKALVTSEQRGHQRLAIYSDDHAPARTWAPWRRLIVSNGRVPRVILTDGVIAGSVVTLIDEIEHRFRHEIESNGVELLEQFDNEVVPRALPDAAAEGERAGAAPGASRGLSGRIVRALAYSAACFACVPLIVMELGFGFDLALIVVSRAHAHEFAATSKWILFGACVVGMGTALASVWAARRASYWFEIAAQMSDTPTGSLGCLITEFIVYAQVIGGLLGAAVAVLLGVGGVATLVWLW